MAQESIADMIQDDEIFKILEQTQIRQEEEEKAGKPKTAVKVELHRPLSKEYCHNILCIELGIQDWHKLKTAGTSNRVQDMG